MGQFNVEQRTKDGFFNATSLLKQWNAAVAKGEKLNPQQNRVLRKKDLDDYMGISPTKDFIAAIMMKEELKGKTDVVKATRGKYNGGTWMHPMLFIDFAMWLNVSFKYDVLKFVYDQMIMYRNNAGDAYRDLSSAISTIVPKDFMPKAMQKVGEALNWVIFNAHEKMMRNKVGEENKMRELFELERKVAELINEGFIKTYEQLLSYLRKKYTEKNYPKVFLS